MTAPPRPERRRGERRRIDRRLPETEDSWFGALGGDTQVSGDGWGAADESRLSGGWHRRPADSRFLSRQARRLVAEGDTTFQRIFRLFVGARAALGLALLAAQAVSEVVTTRTVLPILLVSVAYAAQALWLWWQPSRRADAGSPPRLSRAQWLATIGVDLAAFTALHWLGPGSGFNYVALLVLPVLMAGVLTSRIFALATTSAVALMLLAAAARLIELGGDATVLMTQAGLTGMGFFVITLLAGELAGRLAREELTARGSLELARQQAQLNRLVIEEMADGVLVVDRRARVRAANPAARRLLVAEGMSRAAPFQLAGVPEWRELTDAVAQAFEQQTWPDAGQELALEFESGLVRTVHVRARFTRRRSGGEDAEAPEDLCVLFLEDMRTVQARTRQEKLAAMGRVSAGIAHEIRNPLAAIAQANALLREDAQSVEQAQLTGMVADNVERLKRIVDDVMEVAPGAPPTPRVIDACSEVAACVGEWARTARIALGGNSRLQVQLPSQPMGVVFDPEHLRRVLVNLLDNAQRHASDAAGAIVLAVDAPDEQSVRVSVASDGPPIPPDVERHLFEPFFSTRSRGTGLGLYICRELCERYGADLEYRLRPPPSLTRNEFQITMRRAALVQPDARLHL